MRLKAGQVGQPFSVKDIRGNSIKLENYRGKKLLLSFYRYASCPLCNLRVSQMKSRFTELDDSGLNMVAFFQSPKDSIMEYVGKQAVPFPIVADPQLQVYNAYGIEASWPAFFKSLFTRIPDGFAAMKKGFNPGKMEGKKAMLPADFLIGPDLKIEVAYYGKDIGDHLPIEEIEAWLVEKELNGQ